MWGAGQERNQRAEKTRGRTTAAKLDMLESIHWGGVDTTQCRRSWCQRFVVVQLLSGVWLFATPWTAAHQAPLVLHHLLEFAQTHVHRVGDAIQPSHPLLLLLLLPSIFPSIRVFSTESALCIMWPKYWSFSFSISPSSGYSGLISFRIFWFDLLAVWGKITDSLIFSKVY